MKQFVMDNLLVVIAIGVAVLALAVGGSVTCVKIGDARDHAEELAKKDAEVQSAARSHESPTWTQLSDVGIKNVRDAQEKVIETALKKATRAPLLPDGELIFPDPNLVEGSSDIFKRAYLRTLVARNSARPDQERFLDKMEAGWLPTSEEIAAEQARITNELKNNVPEADLKARLDNVPRELLTATAQKCRIWAGEDCFDNYAAKEIKSTEITPDMLWVMQLNWWVQKDVIEAIAAVNKDKRAGRPAPVNVLTSPIKELCYIEVNRQYLRAAVGSGSGQQPTLTGRVSYDRYDVLLYKFQVVMDASRLPDLAAALGKANFHTVLLAQTESPIPSRKGAGRSAGSKTAGAAAAAVGGVPAPAAVAVPTGVSEFDYGPDSVMLVTLDCEAVFMKSPASWQGNPELARTKRLEFLSRGDNKGLVLAVQRIAPGQPRRWVLKYTDLHGPTASPEKLEVHLQTALLKADAGKAATVDKLKALLDKDRTASVKRYALLDDKPADPSWPAWSDTTLREDLEFIALYEDLMPKAVRDKR